MAGPFGGLHETYGVFFRAFALAVFVTLLCSNAPAAARSHRAPGTGLAKIAYGKPAPDFPFDVNGSHTSLRAFEGHPVVLNFWATWCEPCQDELGLFSRMRTSFGGDVVFIAVSDQSNELTAPYLREHGVDALPVADPDRKIFDLYGVTPLPVTLIIARDGTVTHVSVGELDWLELQTALEAAGSTL